MALALMTYNCLPYHYWHVTTCRLTARLNEIRFQICFKCPSKTTINIKLAGMQSGRLAWHIILLRGGPAGWRLGWMRQSHTIASMPPANQPMPNLEKCWPSRDLNPGPSTFAADALTTELLDWADWLMSNLRWHDGSCPHDLQLPPSH